MSTYVSRRQRVLVLVLSWSFVPAFVAGCTSRTEQVASEGVRGSVQVSLMAEGESGTLYQLRRAQLDLDGPEPRVVNLNGQDEVVRVELDPGEYSATLRPGWEIARQLEDQSFEVVLAALQTPQPQLLTVDAGSVVDLVLDFDVGEDAVSFGKGRVDVTVGVDELDGGAPVCGNGIVQEDEECDDGNLVDDDACSNACIAAVCGDGIVQAATGEQCDDGGPSATCSSECTFLVPPLPEDLPNRPLVYVALGNATVSGPDLAAVPQGAPAIVVVGIYPAGGCFQEVCNYDLGTNPGPVAVGYIQVGDQTYPFPADLAGSIRIENGSDLFLTEAVTLEAGWVQTDPQPATYELTVAGSVRNNGAGFGSAALPRDLSGFGALDWTFAIETLQGSNLVSVSSPDWVVVDSGAVCGDGVIAPGIETCDDGNALGGDGCSPSCLWELEAPSVAGVAYSLYGVTQLFSGLPVRTGTPVLLTANADLQPNCGSTQCSYAINDLRMHIGTTLRSDATGTLSVNANPFFQQVEVRDSTFSLFASMGGTSTPIVTSDLPTAPLDTTQFPSSAGFSDGGVNLSAPIRSWHATLVDCVDGVCSCTPAACPAEPVCGVFPDGCGGYVDCSCSTGACIDGVCSSP